MKNSNIYSAKLIIIASILILCFTLLLMGKTTYVEITDLFIIIIPAYFALSEAGKLIREKNKKLKKKKDKLISRKFLITLVLIVFSFIMVTVNKALFEQVSSFIKILIPIYFASNEVEKFTGFGETKNEG